MPQTINRKRIARQVGKRPDVGKNKTGPRRKRSNGSAAPAPSIIANSLFALTLKAKPEVEVVQKVSGKKRLAHVTSDDDYFKIYTDLLPILHHAVKLVTGEQTKFNPLAEGMEIGFAMHYLLNCFENNVVPKGYSYNIDKDDESYYFTVYKECDFNEYWHAFEIKGIVKHLNRANKKLHDLFIVCIKTFMEYCDINPWWNNTIAFSEEWLLERISMLEDEAESKQDFKTLRAAKQTLYSYEKGDARNYESRIHRSASSTPEKILTQLLKFNKRNRIVKWMNAACEFMLLPGCMNDFHYPEFIEEESNGEGLHFIDQASVIWAWDDYSQCFAEWMDDVANNCGIIPPMLNLRITTENRFIDFNEFEKRSSWTTELTRLHTKYTAIINSLERKK